MDHGQDGRSTVYVRVKPLDLLVTELTPILTYLHKLHFRPHPQLAGIG